MFSKLFPLIAILVGLTACSSPDFYIPVEARLPMCPVGLMEENVTIPMEDMLKSIEGVKEVQSITREGETVVYLEFSGKDLEPWEARNMVNTMLKSRAGDWRKVLPKLPEIGPVVREGEVFLQMDFTVQGISDEEVYHLSHALADSIAILPGVLNVDKSGLPKKVIEARTNVKRISDNFISAPMLEGLLSEATPSIASRRSGKKGEMEREMQDGLQRMRGRDVRNLMLEYKKLKELTDMEEAYHGTGNTFRLIVQAEEGDAMALKESIEGMTHAYVEFNALEITDRHSLNPLCDASSGCHLQFTGGSPEVLAMQTDKLKESLTQSGIEIEVYQTSEWDMRPKFALNESRLATSRLNATDVYRCLANEMEGKLVGKILDGVTNEPVEVRLYYTSGEHIDSVLNAQVPIYISEHDEYVNIELKNWISLTNERSASIHRQGDDYCGVVEVIPKEESLENVNQLIEQWLKATTFPEGISCTMD